MTALPIEPVLSTVRDTLATHRSLVLQAPPGAGKTTLVPQTLLNASWLDGASILMLEPRRLATRAAAERIAELRGERVGDVVGYRMRGESRVGRHTRIEIVTEGILTRRLQHDPTLDGVGVVIFDEFHERSLDADLGLALTLRTQSLVRDDLRIVAMSATLNGDAVARLIGNAPIVTSEGRSFPVETRYVEPRAGSRLEGVVVTTIMNALADADGDILVFLPGAAEIRRVASGGQSLSEEPFIVAAELDDQRPESRVFLATRITLDEIRETFADQITQEDVVEFDEASSAVIARRRERLGAIILRDVGSSDVAPTAIRQTLIEALRARGLATLPWSDAARRLRERMAFIAQHDASWPDVSDTSLDKRLEEWLAPFLEGVRRLADVNRIDLAAALDTLLDWKQRRALDELAPTHIEVPSGSRIAVDYSDPRAPVLAVKIQEVFGLSASPHIAGGRVPVTMHLLSPAGRPMQVTQDLAGFWRTSYFDVRKDLRGRYPKHEWPEDPLTAIPTRHVKRRKADCRGSSCHPKE